MSTTVISFEQITKDREMIVSMHGVAMRSRNCESLAMMLGTINTIVERYQDAAMYARSSSLSSLRVALKYFKMVQRQIDRRANQIQRASINRNAKISERRDHARSLDLLSRAKIQGKINNFLDNPILKQLEDAGYDPLASAEERKKQAERLLHFEKEKESSQELETIKAIQSLENRSVPDIPDGKEFLDLLERPENKTK